MAEVPCQVSSQLSVIGDRGKGTCKSFSCTEAEPGDFVLLREEGNAFLSAAPKGPFKRSNDYIEEDDKEQLCSVWTRGLL